MKSVELDQSLTSMGNHHNSPLMTSYANYVVLHMNQAEISKLIPTLGRAAFVCNNISYLLTVTLLTEELKRLTNVK